MNQKLYAEMTLIMGVFLASFGAAAQTPAQTQKTDTSSSSELAVREKDACAKNLRQIYQAIQAYRKAHKDLPPWLSALVPEYLPSASILICPVTERTGESHWYTHLADPKLRCSYMYEFCDGESGSIWQGEKVKMRDWKRLEMGMVGGGVPILRCLLHQTNHNITALNISFDGKYFESPLVWEEPFYDMVEATELGPKRLLERFAKASKETVFSNGTKTGRPRTDPQPSALLGKAAPSISLDALDGDRFDLGAHKGKSIIILDFWATWCGPCRAALPDLVKIASDYQEKGVLLRAVDLRENAEIIRSYLKKADLAFTVLLDKEGSVGKLYGVNGIPHTVVVGKDGTVQAVHVGYSPENEGRLRRELDAILAGKPLVEEPKN